MEHNPPPGPTARRARRARRATVATALLLAAAPISAQTYCPSDGGSGNTFNIQRVQFAGIDNTSGDNNGYGDFTALSATVTPGTSNTIALDGNGLFFLQRRYRVWVDWDRNGVFAGSELAFQGSGFGQVNGSIAVPANAPAGPTRMRVSMSSLIYQGPCANFSLGEVEDYTVNVTADCVADAGTLTTQKPEVCFDAGGTFVSGEAATDPVVPAGYQVLYVLTEGPGLVIQAVNGDSEFQVNTPGNYTIHTLVYDPATLDLSIVQFGVTTGFDVNGLLIQGGGSICAALDVAGVQVSVLAPDAGTLSGGTSLCSNGGAPVTLTATPSGDANVPAGYQTVYVLTQGAGLTIVNAGPNPSFDVTDDGLYTIHTLVYDPATLDLSIVQLGVTTGFDVNGLLVQGGGSICASLDVPGAAFNVSSPSAGTLSGGASICGDGNAVTLTATPNGDANVPAGYQTVYVLTQGAGLTIVNAGPNPSFDVTDDGLYTIHTLVYDPATLDLSIVQLGVTTGFDVNGLLVQGGGSICASLDVPGAAFNVSSPSAGTLSGGASICGDGNAVTLTATPNGDANVPAGYQTVYVLTQGAGLTIVNAGPNPSFDVTDDGLYTIHTLVYDPATLDLSIVQLGVTTGFDVNGLLVQGGGSICASLDVPGAQFNVASPNAGTLSGGASICGDGNAVTLTATPNGDANVPAGYQTVYVLTQGAGLTIVNAGPNPSFDVTDDGLYTIHTLVYDPATLDLSIVQLGVTTGFDVNGLLVQGGGSICASLDVPGAQFNVASPNAGTLSGGTSICGDGNAVTLTATPNGDANVPAGYQTVYVLTQGAGLTIVNAGPNPSFDVTDDGLYTIHTLVYDPATLDLSIVQLGVTTGFDVNGLLVQGGGSICASLDVPGAQFTVGTPSAGTLTADAEEVCFEQGTVMISATPNGDANVPAGYQTIYVLTQGAGLVIQNVNAVPEFEVSALGTYTIHTLVYDPATLDLSIVQLGVTTGFDVNGLLVQGGGSICASLDVPGAAFNVSSPSAGTLSGGASICGDGNAVTLTATPNGDANVPAGYQTVYVLTQGAGLTIVNAGPNPSFDVTDDGLYTIHTLVYDPATLDLSIVQLGVTTGFDVNGLLIQGGGSICASLDVPGAPFNVSSPSAGTLTAASADVCLENGVATLAATANGDANVPAGYQTVYVLTQGAGLTIVNAGANPSFDVTADGPYTIHTLVYDPATLDLSIVQLGVTTGFDVNGLLVQGGGSICASLDVPGAAFNVSVCTDECLASAGTIAPEDFIECRVGGSATLVGLPGGDAVVPAGYQTLYVLTRGTGLTIQQVSATPVFTVQQLGLYRIHTLVYDPATLDLSIVQLGVTTGFDVNGLLIQGGGSICASLDVTGAPHLVVGPFLCAILNGVFGVDQDGTQSLVLSDGRVVDEELVKAIEQDMPLADLNLWPNPARDVLNIALNTYAEARVEMSVINILGQEAIPALAVNAGKGETRTTIDVAGLVPGQYILRLTIGDGVITQRFTKVD